MNILIILFILLVIWFLSFLLHEFCHVAEGMRQGAKEGSIYIVKYKILPSLRASVSTLKNEFLFRLSGGLYSGLILLPLAFIANKYGYTPFDYSLTLASSANIIYSVFEAFCGGKLEYNKYMILHYVIYLIVFLCVTYFYLPSIMLFINI